MAYSEIIKVKDYQLGADGTLKDSMMMKLMQHAARYDMTQAGCPYEYLVSKNMCFVLVRVALENYHRAVYDDEIRLDTWADTISGAMFVRRYNAWRGDQLIMSAVTLWCLMDLTARRILRPSACGVEFVEHREFSNDLSIPKRVVSPENNTLVGTYDVRYSDLDSNGHLNNTVYLDIIYNCIPDPFKQHLKFFKIDYSGEARLGEKLNIYFVESENNVCYMRSVRSSDDHECFTAKLELDV
ncbi:MAG: hypothetical protein IKC38_01720 [Clostridia bacterium]|nr:hypothetical protein [Clostridia bacterium]